MACKHMRFITPPGWNRRTRFLVKCGKCMPCRIANRTQWQLRFCLERKMGHPLSMVTLTFNDASMRHFDKETFLRLGTINADVKYVQDFIKRLRRRWSYTHNGRNLYLKYFYCSEYGEEHNRLHFHLILSGVGVSQKNLIQECWKYGYVTVLPVLKGGLSYVLDYLDDCSSDPDYNRSRFGSLTPPVHAYSQKIASEYFTRYANKIARDGGIDIGNGKIAPIPSYYRRKIGAELTYEQRKALFRQDSLRRQAFDKAFDECVIPTNKSTFFDTYLTDFWYRLHHKGDSCHSSRLDAQLDEFNEKYNKIYSSLRGDQVKLQSMYDKKRRYGKFVPSGEHPFVAQALYWSRHTPDGTYLPAAVAAKEARAYYDGMVCRTS